MRAYNPATVIDAALTFLASQINAQLLRRNGSSLGAVQLGGVVDERGHWAGELDKSRLTLFQIEEERTVREQLPQRTVVGDQALVLPPPLKLNLIVLISGRFQQYTQALRTLSLILAFLQARPVFTRADNPDLPDGIERLALDLLSYGPEQLNQLWACLGAKHLPSAVYRVRLVALQDTEPTGSARPITDIRTSLGGL